MVRLSLLEQILTKDICLAENSSGPESNKNHFFYIYIYDYIRCEIVCKCK